MTYKIKGMHCDACKTLIMMELEEHDLQQFIEDIVLDEGNGGTIAIHGANDMQLVQIKNVIDQMDNYEVIV